MGGRDERRAPMGARLWRRNRRPRSKTENGRDRPTSIPRCNRSQCPCPCGYIMRAQRIAPAPQPPSQRILTPMTKVRSAIPTAIPCIEIGPPPPSAACGTRFDNLPPSHEQPTSKLPIWAAPSPAADWVGFASQSDLHETCTSFEPSTRDSSRNSFSLRSRFGLA